MLLTLLVQLQQSRCRTGRLTSSFIWGESTMILSAASKTSLIAAILAISKLLVAARSHPPSATSNDGSATDGNWTDGSNWVGGAAPGDTSGGTTSADVATFNAAIAHTWGNAAANPVVIDSPSEIIG